MNDYLTCVNCGKPVPAAREQFPYCPECESIARKLIDEFNRLTEKQQNELLGLE